MNKDDLITKNIPLIYLAIKNNHIYWDTEDEWQYHYDNGLVGLINGARTYDSTKGYKESTYLYKCINKEIHKGIYTNTMKKRVNPYGKDLSLDYLLDENNEDTFLDVIPDPNVNIEQEVENNLEYENIVNAIEHLENEKDKEVMKYYYGLVDGKEHTYEQIANIMNLSKQNIHQRMKRAIKNIKIRVLYHKCSYIQREKISKEKIIVSNNLASLNDTLFEELERLKSDDLLINEEQFNKELKRSNAITQVACQIVQNAKVVLEARKSEKQFNKKLDNFYKLDYKDE